MDQCIVSHWMQLWHRSWTGAWITWKLLTRGGRYVSSSITLWINIFYVFYVWRKDKSGNPARVYYDVCIGTRSTAGGYSLGPQWPRKTRGTLRNDDLRRDLGLCTRQLTDKEHIQFVDRNREANHLWILPIHGTIREAFDRNAHGTKIRPLPSLELRDIKLIRN